MMINTAKIETAEAKISNKAKIEDTLCPLNF
jgi:hypothetical protein